MNNLIAVNRETIHNLDCECFVKIFKDPKSFVNVVISNSFLRRITAERTTFVVEPHDNLKNGVYKLTVTNFPLEFRGGGTLGHIDFPNRFQELEYIESAAFFANQKALVRSTLLQSSSTLDVNVDGSFYFPGSSQLFNENKASCLFAARRLPQVTFIIFLLRELQKLHQNGWKQCN